MRRWRRSFKCEWPASSDLWYEKFALVSNPPERYQETIKIYTESHQNRFKLLHLDEINQDQQKGSSETVQFLVCLFKFFCHRALRLKETERGKVRNHSPRDGHTSISWELGHTHKTVPLAWFFKPPVPSKTNGNQPCGNPAHEPLHYQLAPKLSAFLGEMQWYYYYFYFV